MGGKPFFCCLVETWESFCHKKELTASKHERMFAICTVSPRFFGNGGNIFGGNPLSYKKEMTCWRTVGW